MLNTYFNAQSVFSVVSFRIKAHVRLFGWALSGKTPVVTRHEVASLWKFKYATEFNYNI